MFFPPCAQSAVDTAPHGARANRGLTREASILGSGRFRRGRRAAAAPRPATPPPPRPVARGLGLCGFLRDGVDSAGFCDLYCGLMAGSSAGAGSGERLSILCPACFGG